MKRAADLLLPERPSSHLVQLVDGRSDGPHGDCIWGEDDPNGGAETAKHFVDRLPHATLELVADAGHAPWIDEPERAITSALTFLNG